MLQRFYFIYVEMIKDPTLIFVFFYNTLSFQQPELRYQIVVYVHYLKTAV